MQHDRQRFEQRIAGSAWTDHGLVFATPGGGPIDPSHVTHRLQRLLADAGLPRMRFHDLRHGYATLAVATGADLGTVRDALGHSSIAVTQIYAHIVPRLKRDVADRLDALMTGS